MASFAVAILATANFFDLAEGAGFAAPLPLPSSATLFLLEAPPISDFFLIAKLILRLSTG